MTHSPILKLVDLPKAGCYSVNRSKALVVFHNLYRPILKLERQRGIEPLIFSMARRYHTTWLLAQMVGDEGVEPPSTGCRPVIIPLYQPPIKLVEAAGVEPALFLRTWIKSPAHIRSVTLPFLKSGAGNWNLTNVVLITSKVHKHSAIPALKLELRSGFKPLASSLPRKHSFN